MDFLIADGNDTPVLLPLRQRPGRRLQHPGHRLVRQPDADPDRPPVRHHQGPPDGHRPADPGQLLDRPEHRLFRLQQRRPDLGVLRRLRGLGQIVNVTNQAWHDFHTYGSSLRWKAVLSAAEDPCRLPERLLRDAGRRHPPDGVRLCRAAEYSRSSAAATTSDRVGPAGASSCSRPPSSSPGRKGQLRAYDVTDIRVSSTSGSTIQTISQSDPFSATGRTVASGGDDLLGRRAALAGRGTLPTGRSTARTGRTARRPIRGCDFTTANTATLASLLADVDSDNAGLIEFVRGVGRDWKLGDILHSSPIIMGPPEADSVAMGTGYAAFMQAWAGRTPVVFVGANDGMLHCFDAGHGAGAVGLHPLQPPSQAEEHVRQGRLLGRAVLRPGPLTWTGRRPSATPTSTEPGRRSSSAARARGYGSSVGGGLNYYFALDVTDPANPQPLWELTDTYMGETWSVPAIGQVVQSGDRPSGWPSWARATTTIPAGPSATASMSSGWTPAPFWSTRSVSNVNSNATSHPHRYTDIYVTIPGSPTAVDTNRDGRTEYVYVGDLDGRLYRMTVDQHQYQQLDFDRHLYRPLQLSDHHQAGASIPIPPTGGLPVRIYFGTGGDDRAPADRPYAFIGLSDDGGSQTVEWYMGDAAETGLASSPAQGRVRDGREGLGRPGHLRQDRLFQHPDGQHRERQSLPQPGQPRPPLRPLRPVRGRQRPRRHGPQELVRERRSRASNWPARPARP